MRQRARLKPIAERRGGPGHRETSSSSTQVQARSALSVKAARRRAPTGKHDVTASRDPARRGQTNDHHRALMAESGRLSRHRRDRRPRWGRLSASRAGPPAGGYAQVIPMEDSTSTQPATSPRDLAAHNLLAPMIATRSPRQQARDRPAPHLAAWWTYRPGASPLVSARGPRERVSAQSARHLGGLGRGHLGYRASRTCAAARAGTYRVFTPNDTGARRGARRGGAAARVSHGHRPRPRRPAARRPLCRRGRHGSGRARLAQVLRPWSARTHRSEATENVEPEFAR